MDHESEIKIDSFLPKSSLRFNTKLYNSYFFYKIRLLRCKHYQRVFYRLVVVNRYNSIVDDLGFYNPFAVSFRLSYRNISKPMFFSKVVGINRPQVMFWLEKGAIVTPIVSIILLQMGLFKTHSKSLQKTVCSFYFKRRQYSLKFYDFFFRELFLLKNLNISGKNASQFNGIKGEKEFFLDSKIQNSLCFEDINVSTTEDDFFDVFYGNFLLGEEECF